MSLILEDCDLLDAYFALITPSESEKTMHISDYEAKWTATYEAEEATLLGNAKAVSRTGGSDLARSNRTDVENIFSEKDGVKYNVEVPKDGIYEAQVYYSVAAPFVNAAAHKNEPRDPPAVAQHQRVAEFIRFFVDILRNEEIGEGSSMIKDCFSQCVQERVGASADDQSDRIAGLLQPAGILVSDEAVFFNDSLNHFPCCRVNIRTMVQHTADSRYRDACQFCYVFDCNHFHSYSPSFRNNIGNDIGNVTGKSIAQSVRFVNYKFCKF